VIATEQGLIKELDESRAVVQDGRSAFAEHKEKGQILSALLEQKNNGNIPGIHGRLVRIVLISYMYLGLSFSALTPKYFDRL